ncbi:hypothetical protein AWC38_SpisGene23033 [Stylophora pistillata]|uniref:Uncharacterized protein n=1 Tax=Stylophora pistillata TaxID=50429 RepID=A0A2B4R3L7_STYPI|nr:hypothetical protein AWC38_SpisGene23033 [Stylophora pistillata]
MDVIRGIMSTKRAVDINSAKNELRPFADEQKMSFLKRIRRDALKVAGKPNPGIMYDAEKCFTPKGDNDAIFKPDFVSLTFEELNSYGIYEGKISWKPHSDAEKCFTPKGDNDAIFKPDFVSLTFEELNSYGIYEGKISWKPHSDDELDGTEYRIIYSIHSERAEKLLWLKCQEVWKVSAFSPLGAAGLCRLSSVQRWAVTTPTAPSVPPATVHLSNLSSDDSKPPYITGLPFA